MLQNLPMKNVFYTTLASIAAICFTCSAERTVGTSADFKGPVGLQLYSLRANFAKDVPGTLDKVHAMGFKYVELAGTYDLKPAEYKKMLEARGFKAIGNHFPFERWQNDLDNVVKEAVALGLPYAGCAWIPHKGKFTEQDCRDAAAVFNRAGEALAKHGIKFYYHTHGYEFQPHDKGTLFDLLMAETNPKYVAYEMDVFWIVFPAQDPVALLNKYGKRFVMMHLKDLEKGVKTGSLSGGTDVRHDVVLGTGQVNWPAVLKAAQKAGVKYYFIEDESPTAEEQIPQSLKFLEQIKF